MSLTLLALFMLPFSLKLVLDPSGTHQMLREWSKSPALQWVNTLIPLTIAVLIFSTSAMKFAWSWDSLLSWMGLLIAIKAVSHLFPSLIAWKMRLVTEARLPIFGFLSLLILLGMVYVDTQLL